eukprot:9216716-Prorocentrum_lima.AAC.1
MEIPPGVRPLTVRWVDKDDYDVAKSRLTVRGYEQTLTGDEAFYAATPHPAMMRTLLVMAQ